MRRVRGTPGAGKGGMVHVVSSAGKVSMLVSAPFPPMTTAIRKMYTYKPDFNLIGKGSKTY